MPKTVKILVVVVIVIVVALIAILKQSTARKPESVTTGAEGQAGADTAEANSPGQAEPKRQKLPRLVDLGAGKCIPCKMMAPILEELKRKYAGRLEVEFIDVWKEPDKAKEYGISIIPTQIFYDASGKELLRHEGFFSKEDILGKWKEIGINLEGGKQNESN
jgi:thioredoxin 1